MLQGKEHGFQVEVAQDDEDQETWEEAMEEMEDIWMREPAGMSATHQQLCTALTDAYG